MKNDGARSTFPPSPPFFPSSSHHIWFCSGGSGAQSGTEHLRDKAPWLLASPPSLSNAHFEFKTGVSGVYCNCTCANNTNHQPVINSRQEEPLSLGLFFFVARRGRLLASPFTSETQINQGKARAITKVTYGFF